MSDLKPCPFCGGEAELFASPAKDGWNYVFCKKCQTAGDNYDTVAEAIEAWNTRHERMCTVANLGGRLDSLPILLCESCGAFTYSKADGSTWNYCPNCGARVKEG